VRALPHPLRVRHVAEGLAPGVAADLSGGDQGGALGGFAARAGDMGGEDEVRRPEEAGVRRRWLGVVDVEGGGAEVAAVEGVAQRVGVEEAAAGAVDDDGAAGQTSDLVATEEVLGLGGQAGVQADRPDAGEEVVEGDKLGADGRDHCRIDIRIGNENLSAEGVEDAGDAAPDRAEANETDGFAFQLLTGRLVSVKIATPDAVLEVPVAVGDVTQRGEEEADGVLGGGSGVAAGGVADGDAAGGGGGEVDVDGAATTDDDQPEVAGGGEDPLGEGGHLGHGDLDAGDEGAHLLLGADRFPHLGDRAERLDRPGQLNRRRIEAVTDLVGQGIEEEPVQDEPIAGDKGLERSGGGAVEGNCHARRSPVSASNR